MQSIEITDKSFNGNWYQFGLPIKRIFMLLMMTNNVECKIAAIEKFNLSLPSFMTVRFNISFYALHYQHDITILSKYIPLIICFLDHESGIFHCRLISEIKVDYTGRKASSGFPSHFNAKEIL